jgi:1-acyl-sn-glycerol-3-phosphate acyltransferase
MIRVSLYTILSLLVFASLYLVTIILILIALFFAYLGLRKAMYTMINVWARSVFVIMGKKIRIVGKDNIQPGKKYILLSNHASAFDVPAIMSFFPGVSWFGREHLLKIPLFGQILKVSNYIPMKRAGAGQTRKMLEHLISNSNGATIAIFPEGTRTLSGKINRFHKGFIHVMRTSGLDLLPVTLNGFYQLKPKNRFYISFHAPISATIHPPVPYEKLSSLSDEEVITTVRGMMNSSYHTRDKITGETGN